MRCMGCDRFQILDLSMWNPKGGLRRCRVCQRASAGQSKSKPLTEGEKQERNVQWRRKLAAEVVAMRAEVAARKKVVAGAGVEPATIRL